MATEVVLTPTTVQTVATGRRGNTRSRSRSALLRETTTTSYPAEEQIVVIGDGRNRNRSRGRSISVVRQTNKHGKTTMELRRSKSRGRQDAIIVGTKRRESEVRGSIERGSERGYYDEDYISDGEDDFIFESRSRNASVVDRRSRSRLRGRRRQLDEDDERLVQEYRVEGIRRAPSRSRWVKQKAKTIIRIAIDLVEPSALQSLSASVREVFDDEVVLTYNRPMTEQDVIDIYLAIASDGRDSDEDYEISCHNEQSVDEYILKDVRTSNYSPSPRRRTPTRYIDGSTVRLLRNTYDEALMSLPSDRETGRERSLSRPGRSLSRRRRSIVRKTRPTPPPVDSYRFPDQVARAEFTFPSVCTARKHTIKHYECSCYDDNRSWDLLDRIRVIQEKACRLLEIPDIERTHEDYEDIYRYRAELEFRIKEVITIRRTLYERARAGRDRASNRGSVLSGTFGDIGSSVSRVHTIADSDSDGYFPGQRVTRRESTYFERDSRRSISRPRRSETAPVVIQSRRDSDYSDLDY